MKSEQSYAEFCKESVEALEKEIDRLTEISGLDSIPAWMVKDLVAKAHHQGTVDCSNMYINKMGENINEERF